MIDLIFDIDSSKIAVFAEQTSLNYSTVHFDVTGLDSIDKIIVTASIMYEGEAKTSIKKVITVAISSIGKSFDMDFKNFGKFSATIAYYYKRHLVKSQNLEVGVVAEEYNVAVLNASFPVLYFSMSLWDISNNNGKPIPTYVALERSGAYDWDALPPNVYALPTARKSQITSSNSEQNNQFGAFRLRMAKYIQDLHDLRPGSKFNLYCTDNYPELVLDFIFASGIDENHYTATLLSDKSGSYYWFNQVYNVADVPVRYATMKNEWNQMKQSAIECNLDYKGLATYGLGNEYQVLEKYTYVIANEEPNINWWFA